MKPKYLIIIFILCFINYSYGTDIENPKNKNNIISKIEYSELEIDTFRVSQDDTTVFKREDQMIHHACSNPKLSVRYNLIKPINNAYYFIYNDKQQLVLEGKYTAEYIYEGTTIKRGSFYNSKDYSYRRNGSIDIVHHMKDGRNHKTEHFNQKKQLTKIRYFDKKSSEIDKIEIYKKDQLKETRIYTSFSNYYTIKAEN